MRWLVRGYIDFFISLGYLVWFAWLIAYALVRFSAGLLSETIICVVVQVLKSSGALQTIRGKRWLVRFFRVMPLGKSWRRSGKKVEPIIEHPFAIDLYEIDPLCFVGMSRIEISALLSVPIDKEYAERGTAEVTWNRKDFHVECWFEGEICRHCFFYNKDAQGKLEKISDTY